MGDAIRAVELPAPIRRRIEFFTSQFELCDTAADQFEYKTKDTARLSGIEWSAITSQDTGRDRLKDLGCQTRNGLSVRNLMTLLHYAKALAFFRGNGTVELTDVRQILPFVLHNKLVQDADAPFFETAGNAPFRTDQVGWLRKLFDLACAEYDQLDLDRHDVVAELDAELESGLDGVADSETRKRLLRIERAIGELTKGRKLYGHLYDDLLKLKYLHQRYTNYLSWLESR
jgi:hypothetical protein